MSNNMEFKKTCLWWCLHHITHYESKYLLSYDDVCWCWKQHFAQFIYKRLHVHHVYNWNLWWMLHYQILISFGHIHMLDYSCRPVIHIISTNWAHCSIMNPNDFFYPMPNTPTQPCCNMHQQPFLLLLIAHILQEEVLHFQDSKKGRAFPIYFLFLFIPDFSCSPSMSTSALQSLCKILDIL